MTNFLVADGGSTKTKWSFIAESGKTVSLATPGINPYYMNTAEIVDVAKATLDYSQATYPDRIYYYGAGCNTPSKKEMIASALRQVFGSEDILVDTDLLGAARALCGNAHGIACILGTGSNSCYYDGWKIQSNVSPLGYILGDEGSGAVLGKKLIADVLKKQLPDEIIRSFYETHKVTDSEILEKVYKEPFPNRYLAQFATFISANIHFPELENLVANSFDEFILRNLFQYEKLATSEVHFTGSIAFIFAKQLIKAMSKHGLRTGKIIKDPMKDLVVYHLQER